MLSGNIKALGLPIYVIEAGDDISGIQDSICYLVTKDGVMVRKSNHLYSAISKVSSVSGLEEVKESSSVKCVKLRRGLLDSIVSFFRDVYDERRAEAAVLLYFSKEFQKWAAVVPFQEVSGSSVKYNSDRRMCLDEDGNIMAAMPDAYKPMGSIHSHAAMSAFHSGTDDKDEFNFDGLHITVGRVDERIKDFAVRWITAGQAIKSTIDDVVEGAVETKTRSPLMEMIAPKRDFDYRSKDFVASFAESDTFAPRDWRGNTIAARNLSEPKKVEDQINPHDYGIVMHQY